MRLLELKTHDECCLTEFSEGKIPRYAILSHTWRLDGEEVIFKDFTEGTSNRKAPIFRTREAEVGPNLGPLASPTQLSNEHNRLPVCAQTQLCSSLGVNR